jgi:hypothetical protein
MREPPASAGSHGFRIGAPLLVALVSFAALTGPAAARPVGAATWRAESGQAR